VLSSLSEAKLKDGIFIGPQIRKVLKDEKFENCLSDNEKAACLITKKLLGDHSSR
jgi:hypothetical protein